jgi:hypothetical protein
MPGVGVMTKLVSEGPFVATETLHSDLRELGGGPHLVGVAGDEEDGTVTPAVLPSVSAVINRVCGRKEMT